MHTHRMRAWWAVGAALTLGTLTMIAPNLVQASDHSGAGVGPARTVAQADAMAVREFPSGVGAVVLCSGDQRYSVDVVAGQALATHLGAPLLLSSGVNALGNAADQALKDLNIPQVSNTVQPFQPMAGKPVVYIVGGKNAISPLVTTLLRAQGYQIVRVGGRNAQHTLEAVDRIVAPALPSGKALVGFPQTWTTYAGGQSHNAVFKSPSNAPQWEKNGVSWQYAEMAAVPLQASFPDTANLGLRGAPVKMTQDLGNAVGVTAANGIIYAESDDFHLYALSARTGKQLWTAGPTVNSLMGNPIVGQGLVYVTAGDTGFPFSQVLKYELSGGTQALVRGLMYSAIYAYNAQTGRLVWRQDFHGNAMPSPVLVGNTVYEATGGGNLWAMNAQTGQVLWKTSLGGFDSMSSANFWTNPVTGVTEIIVGTSDANHLVAVDAATGKILWTQPTTLKIFNTGMGDNSPTVDAIQGIVIQDSVVNFNQATKTCNLAVYAMDASTGQVLWSTDLGVGSAPPAYKAGVTMVKNGVVYVGSPVTSALYALSESTGKILWSFSFKGAGPAGAGRGNAVYAYGTLWVAAGPTIYALNPTTGQELGSYSPGGRFGIVNPVIVGGTMYLDNSYDWVQAIPLTKIYPGVKISYQ